MVIHGSVFLASCTTRSQTYAQALSFNNISPEHVLIFGNSKNGNNVDFSHMINNKNKADNIYYPDLNIPLQETCKNSGWNITEISDDNINSIAIINWIKTIKPKLIIYSGYGGQLVGEELINTGFPILHIHSGWLPDERGSTTIYYSILQGKGCGVSAIILEKGIDTGGIIARKRYPLPKPDINIDYIYDNAIRADLLVEVLKNYNKDDLLNTLNQNHLDGNTYYVIHPVLKHIAVLSLNNEKID